ncbi:hypothetical protein Leryth_018742 [Lithospermum erythrorhizon]|nr:hypothetical protein Leryth_018742 [Lithospermum erythrorhizon]
MEVAISIINEAIQSIPTNNMKRVDYMSFAGGYIRRRSKIDRTKPFVTFFVGHACGFLMGDAKQFGTVDSATLIVESDYFNAVNIKIVNSAIRPNGGEGQQAVALRIGGDKASFYNCKLIGFQDTLCDDKGRHFFKDCYIEGTVDFIFGSGKSIYLMSDEDEGFSMVHCTVTGSGGTAFLGRAWMAYPKVTFAFTEMSDVVNKEGWSNNKDPKNDNTVIFGEYRNIGPGADLAGRAKFVKQLTDAEVQTLYLSWLHFRFFLASSSNHNMNDIK